MVRVVRRGTACAPLDLKGQPRPYPGLGQKFARRVHGVRCAPLGPVFFWGSQVPSADMSQKPFIASHRTKNIYCHRSEGPPSRICFGRDPAAPTASSIGAHQRWKLYHTTRLMVRPPAATICSVRVRWAARAPASTFGAPSRDGRKVQVSRTQGLGWVPTRRPNSTAKRTRTPRTGFGGSSPRRG